MLKAVIVDDERLARRELRSLLGAHGDVAVVSEAETVATAAEVVRVGEADVVFLDIQLGGESGFDLLPHLEPAVAVIFVTAYDHYAVKAFELNALDYLLKPVVPERLAAALARCTGRHPPLPADPGALDPDDYLFLRVGERMRFVKVHAIAAVATDGDHTRLHFADGTSAHVRRPLRDWEARLPPARFVRVHRQAMINLDFAERVDDWSHATYVVHVRGVPGPIHVSRRYAALLRERRG